MKKYLLYSHGGSGNHGCEALARTAIEMIERCDQGPKEIILASYRPEEDRQYLSDKKIRIVPYRHSEKSSLLKVLYTVSRRLGIRNNDWYYRRAHKDVIGCADQNTVALSIGGDNYCYGSPTAIYHVNRELRNKGVRTVLFGCSINSDGMDDEMIRDLKGYDLIHVRESLTHESLKSRGVRSNVILYPDTAFTLAKSAVDLKGADDFFKRPVVGINLSPLLNRFEKEQGVALNGFIQLVDHIIRNTDYNVALVPHVIWENNDDRVPLKIIYDRFSESGRVRLFDDCNCLQLKQIISKCSLFVGARTHATIAAYSSKIPTLVVGYSVKALGIAKDLLGSYEGHVITVQDIQDPGKLLEAFQSLEREQDVRKRQLEESLDSYRERVDALAQEYTRFFSRGATAARTPASS